MRVPDTTYHPTSRRPIADAFRRTGRIAVRICVAANIHPDAVSYSSIVVSAGAGVCFWRAGQYPWLLLAGPMLCYLRLWLNMLDGMVALAAGKASHRGEILNDLPDRISDILIFVGVGYSGLAAPWAGFWTAIAALLTAYVGMLGQAVGVQREFSGMMSKPSRMVTLHIGAWLTLALLWFGHAGAACGRFTILEWTCLIVIAGCIQTIAIRLKKIMSALKAKQIAASSKESPR